MSHFRGSRLVGLVCALALVTVGIGCSKKSSNAPPAGIIGPSFSFTFPAAGTVGNVGTVHTQTFSEAGTFNYHCIPHESGGMTGTIVVSASSSVDSVFVQVGSGAGFSFSPQTATIKVGGSIRWANVSAMTIHTVTRP